MTYEEIDKIIQDLMRQFDAEFKNKGFELSGTRFVKLGDKNLNQIEYVKFQLEKLNK